MSLQGCQKVKIESWKLKQICTKLMSLYPDEDELNPDTSKRLSWYIGRNDCMDEVFEILEHYGIVDENWEVNL